MSIRRLCRTETLRDTLLESMKIGKELEVLVQEERDPVGETGAMRGREAGEIIIKRVEETTEETTARALAEETIAQIGRAGEIIAQDIEGTEARRGREAEEIIMRVEETIGETTVRAQAEEITVQRGKAEEIIVQGTGRRRVDPGVEKTTHLRRAEGTLAKIDEGVAKGPLVMEGPQQASP